MFDKYNEAFISIKGLVSFTQIHTFSKTQGFRALKIHTWFLNILYISKCWNFESNFTKIYYGTNILSRYTYIAQILWVYSQSQLKYNQTHKLSTNFTLLRTDNLKKDFLHQDCLILDYQIFFGDELRAWFTKITQKIINKQKR